MADDGWIKLHRKLLENPIFINPELLQLFLYCLIKANHKDKEIIWNGVLKTITRGSFITGFKVLCKDVKQKQTSIHRRLKLLGELGYISVKSENKFSIVTVLKYNSYQINDFESGKQVENKWKTNGKQVETTNNDKNDKNDKKGQHLFRNSDYYDIEKFKEAFYANPKYKDFDYEYYYESVLNWSEGKGAMKKDWIATARNFANRDEKPKLIKPNVIKLPTQ